MEDAKDGRTEGQHETLAIKTVGKRERRSPRAALEEKSDGSQETEDATKPDGERGRGSRGVGSFGSSLGSLGGSGGIGCGG
jgi:hypothetical protein